MNQFIEDDDEEAGDQSPKVAPIKRPAALNNIMFDRLREDIITGVFAFGIRLSEEMLSKLYGVTKAPVRSALVKLQAEGLLKIEPNRGAFVMDPSPEDVLALCELRVALEMEAARLAMKRDRERLVIELTEIVGRMRPLSQRIKSQAYQTLDFDFHHAFFRAAHSKMLEEAYMSSVRSRFAALMNRLSNHVFLGKKSFEEHVRLLDLVKSNESELLVELLRSHIERMVQYDRESRGVESRQ